LDENGFLFHSFTSFSLCSIDLLSAKDPTYKKRKKKKSVFKNETVWGNTNIVFIGKVNALVTIYSQLFFAFDVWSSSDWIQT
jgi:hypothetical protein